MIVTVTLNPALDKTAQVAALCPHALNRLAAVQTDVGGKGVNVSRTIAALGGQSTACGFVAGGAGRAIAAALQQPGVTPDLLFVEGETRTNLKLVEPDGALTEFNEPGPLVTAAQLDALAEKLEGYAAPGTLFVLAGSVGPGVPTEVYRTLTVRLHQKGARIFLDADGPLLAEGVQAAPDIIKPNGFELCGLFGRPETGEEAELLAMGRQLAARGVGLICISLGGAGACFVSRDASWRAPALPVEVHSTVGAGDAMVAGIAYGLDRGLPLEDALRWGVATSAAACTTSGTGPGNAAQVRELYARTVLQRLG